jgi:transposase
MGRPSRFSPEVRERAVRMVEEHREAHASEWAVLQSVAPKLGCTAETLRSGFGRRSVMPAIGRG